MYIYYWKAKGIPFVFCLTHIQILNLWVHMNMIKWLFTHASMLVINTYFFKHHTNITKIETVNCKGK